MKNRQAHVAVIGLGYVGLPLAVEFARSGFSVTGVDVSGDRVGAVNEGRSYIADVDDGDVGPLAADHSAFDYRQIVASSRVVVDTRNATGKAGLKEPEKIVKI